MSNWYMEPVDGEVTKEEIMKKAENGDFHTWNYEADPFCYNETGYEDVMDTLLQYKASDYMELNSKREQAVAKGDEEKAIQYKNAMDKMVEDVFQIYRGKNIYTTTYYSEMGIEKEILECIDYKAFWDGNVVSCGVGVGTGLCKFLFPNLQDTASKHDIIKKNAENMYAKFYNDKFLKKAIRFCYSYKTGCPVPKAVESGLRLVGSAPSNFRPMNAKAIYERFCPENGLILDMCSGFGGRLLGCLSSKNNYKYIGCDPNTETMYNLHRLGQYIENITDRENSYELHCVGSEDFCGPENSIDFMFTSPPYFDLEVYSDEPTQCYNKFPVLEDWLEGYVRVTIRNTIHMLKKGNVYAINIADFNIKDYKVNYVDKWIEISKQEGAPLFDTVYLGITARAGSLEQNAGELKKENILIFKKM